MTILDTLRVFASALVKAFFAVNMGREFWDKKWYVQGARPDQSPTPG